MSIHYNIGVKGRNKITELWQEYIKNPTTISKIQLKKEMMKYLGVKKKDKEGLIKRRDWEFNLLTS
jgi:hypothetical protein